MVSAHQDLGRLNVKLFDARLHRNTSGIMGKMSPFVEIQIGNHT